MPQIREASAMPGSGPMRNEPYERHQGMSNQFNTAADAGIGPLRLNKIRSRLVADLFFADQMCIPGTSFLCNPATYKMLNEDVDFLVRLITDKRIAAILIDDTPSFTALTENLIDSGSAAFKTSGQSVSAVRDAARLLDQNLSKTQIITVKREDVEKARADTSFRLVRDIGRVLPNLPDGYDALIAQSARRELDRNGTITGNWWVDTVKEEIPELRLWDAQFTEFGNIAFDFGYANAADGLPLLGHPYNYDLEGFGKIAEPFAANYGVEVSPGILDRRDIDASFFDKEALATMEIESFVGLADLTQAERSRYYQALREFRLQGSQDHLLEAKERLDEYLTALSGHLRSSGFMRFANQSKLSNRMASQILIWQAADVTIYSFAVAGGLHELVQHSLGQTSFGLFILAGLGTGGVLVSRKISSLKQRLESRRQHYQESLKRARPASIYVTTSMSP
jgi:hypothetical protein